MFIKTVNSIYTQAKIIDPIESRVLEKLSTKSTSKIEHALKVYDSMQKRIEVVILANPIEFISLNYYRKLLAIEDRFYALCQKYQSLTMKFDPKEMRLLVFYDGRLIYSIYDNLDIEEEVVKRLDAIEEIVTFYRSQGLECCECDQNFAYRLQFRNDEIRIDIWLSLFDKIIVDQIGNRELVVSSRFKYQSGKDHSKYLKIVD